MIWITVLGVVVFVLFVIGVVLSRDGADGIAVVTTTCRRCGHSWSRGGPVGLGKGCPKCGGTDFVIHQRRA
jgi:ribosomal protein S27AE